MNSYFITPSFIQKKLPAVLAGSFFADGNRGVPDHALISA